MSWANTFSYLLGWSTVAGDILAVALIAILFSPEHRLRRFVERYALWAMFLIALGGTVASLIYSDILHFAPCNMCWYQRTVLYPQVIMLGLAIFYKDKRIARYIAWLSALGVVMAIYTHGLEMGWIPEGVICGTGAAVTCTRRYVYELGYVTIPIMALTGFALNWILALFIARGSES